VFNYPQSHQNHKVLENNSTLSYTGIQMELSLVCDKSIKTQNLTFLSYWCIKKRLQMHF